MKSSVWLAASLALLICPVCLRAGDGGGPVQWTEPTQPPTLDDSTWTQLDATRFADIEANSNPEQVTPETPWAGVLVTGVDAKSQAQSLQIKTGDVLVESNGEQVYDVDDWDRHRDAGDTKMTVWSPATGKREITTKPGLIGIDPAYYYFRPEVLYLRGLAPGQKPDRVLFAAAVCAQSEPLLGRAAIAHARKGGSTDNFIYFVDAIAASECGHFDDAVASGMWAMHVGSDAQKRVLAPMMRSAALATFRLSLAAQLEKDFPDTRENTVDEFTGKDNSVDLNKTIAQCETLRSAGVWLSNKNCADVFAGLASTEQSGYVFNAAGPDDGDAQKNMAPIRQSAKIAFNSPDGKQEKYILGPTGANVKFSASCRFFPNKKSPDSPGLQGVHFGVALEGNDVPPIQVTLCPDGTVVVAGSHIPDFQYQLAGVYPLRKPFDVSMIIVGNRCEIDVAGIQAFRGPILEEEKSRQLCLFFNAVMIKGQLSQFSWATADAKK